MHRLLPPLRRSFLWSVPLSLLRSLQRCRLRSFLRPLLLASAWVVGGLGTASAAAEPQTVCTITVNSADEKDAFRQALPEDRFRFVELVERGRPDWLASACRAGVRCDVLIVSGHFDGSNEFFSEDLAKAPEYLMVSELERVSCSESCPGLFSRLKEVYLFGCNTLNPEPLSSISAEVVRSLVREGHSPQEAERRLQELQARQGESSRDRMRQVFKGVPVIYGFSSLAPLGPVAGETLDRYFRSSSGAREVGLGRRSSRLLDQFAPFGLASAAGISEREPLAQVRRDMCQFADDRITAAQRLAFVHRLLQRPVGAARVHFDRIQRTLDGLDGAARRQPAIARRLDAIANDFGARSRLLALAKDTHQAPARVRLLDLARDLGWLSAEHHQHELILMLGELQARARIGPGEIDLACTLNRSHALDGTFSRRLEPGGPTDDVAHAAVRACLGSAEAHARTLAGLASPAEADVQAAQAYLRRRPITDLAELRGVAEAIAGMAPSDAQVRALESLGRLYLNDRPTLERLTELYVQTPSWAVQAAVAGILIRADLRDWPRDQLLITLRGYRQPSPPGQNMIDALIRKLQPA